MKHVLDISALVLVISTALPLLQFDKWWIRVFDFPRTQITVAGVFLLALYLYYWEAHRVYEFVVVGLLALAVGFQVVKDASLHAADAQTGTGG